MIYDCIQVRLGVRVDSGEAAAGQEHFKDSES